MMWLSCSTREANTFTLTQHRVQDSLSLTKSSPLSRPHIYTISSLFNPNTALVPHLWSSSLVHLILPLWKPLTTLSVIHQPVSGINLLLLVIKLLIITHQSLSLSSHLSRISSPAPSSSLSSPIISFLFHFRLKTHLFHKSFPRMFFYVFTHRTADSTDCPPRTGAREALVYCDLSM